MAEEGSTSTVKIRPPTFPPERYALMGFPVRHSWSPFIHGMFARQTGQNMQYRLAEVPPDEFRAAVTQYFADGGRGLNVTVPHKQAAAQLVQELTPRAARARAVNTILPKGNTKELLGDNTDGVGLVADLRDNLGLKLAGMRILILGAGGATRGVLGPLLERRPVSVSIANRTVEKAAELAAEFGALGTLHASGFDDVEGTGYDLVINATSASLQGDVPSVPAGVIGPRTIAYDMAYARAQTPFTSWALAHGAAAAHRGWGMLVEQAAEAFNVWRGVRPETKHVLELLQAGTLPDQPR